jgi:hypothetical protein
MAISLLDHIVTHTCIRWPKGDKFFCNIVKVHIGIFNSVMELRGAQNIIIFYSQRLCVVYHLLQVDPVHGLFIFSQLERVFFLGKLHSPSNVTFVPRRMFLQILPTSNQVFCAREINIFPVRCSA